MPACALTEGLLLNYMLLTSTLSFVCFVSMLCDNVTMLYANEAAECRYGGFYEDLLNIPIQPGNNY